MVHLLLPLGFWAWAVEANENVGHQSDRSECPNTLCSFCSRLQHHSYSLVPAENKSKVWVSNICQYKLQSTPLRREEQENWSKKRFSNFYFNLDIKLLEERRWSHLLLCALDIHNIRASRSACIRTICHLCHPHPSWQAKPLDAQPRATRAFLTHSTWSFWDTSWVLFTQCSPKSCGLQTKDRIDPTLTQLGYLRVIQIQDWELQVWTGLLLTLHRGLQWLNGLELSQKRAKWRRDTNPTVIFFLLQFPRTFTSTGDLQRLRDLSLVTTYSW